MSQDTFISRMMAETFESDDTVARSRSAHPEQDFRLRRGLAKLPVAAFEGRWLGPGLAQFSFHGTVLDLPMGHQPFMGWASSEGLVTDRHPLIGVCSKLLGKEFSHVFAMQSEDDKPWLILWNSQEEMVDVAKVRKLFTGEVLEHQAA
jgi:hypothetical protein